ncbi:MAG: hypothetical protein JWO09_3026 [Bacteroidetes bacterium]|nr:hypothetical protein [Bacteroidota bacterium]
MKLLLTQIFFLFLLSANAQLRGTGAIITLHPSLGKTITPEEKKEFGLFADYPDSNFETANFVKYDDSTYTVLFKTPTGSFERSITATEVAAIHAAIEKQKPAPPLPPQEPEEPRLSGENDLVDTFCEGLVKSIGIAATIFEIFNSGH